MSTDELLETPIELEETNALGELSDDYTVELEQEESDSNAHPASSEDDPEFTLPEEEVPKRCKTCGNAITPVSNVEGECPHCAIKRMRRMERKLVEIRQLKNERTYCTMEGHREVTKTPLFPDWDGKIVINGVELYPVYPVCKGCIDQLTAYLVYFLEQRGIVRKGSGNSKNPFGEPLNSPLGITEASELQKKLVAFLSNITLYALDDRSPVNRVYNYLRDRRKVIATARIKEAKRWLNESKAQKKKDQVEKDAKSLLESVAESQPKNIAEKEVRELQMKALALVRELLEKEEQEKPELMMKDLWIPFLPKSLEERLEDPNLSSRFHMYRTAMISSLNLQGLAVHFVDNLLEEALDFALHPSKLK